MAEQLIQDAGIKDEFLQWIEETGRAPNSAVTYWYQIRNLPMLDLREQSVTEIAGAVNRRITTPLELTASRRYIHFLFHRIKEDNEVDDEQVEEYREKRQRVLFRLSLDEDAEEPTPTRASIERHFLTKEDLVTLLRKAEPDRARLWAMLYFGMFRWGELKRIGPEHLREDYGTHGAAKIPQMRTKSKFRRTLPFLSPYPSKLLEDAPVGNWTDNHGNEWENVYWPDRTNGTENYWLGYRRTVETKDGEEERIYGHIKGTGIEPRSSHSMRHTRCSDLVEDTERFDLSIDEVRRRMGHTNLSTTQTYIEAAHDRKPRPLEVYLDENDIDLIEIIEEE